MTSKLSATGELVLEYVQKNQSVASHTLAKILFKKFPLEFRDSEHARSYIRYYRGQDGNRNRVSMDPKYYVPKIVVPEGDSEDNDPFIMDTKLYPVIAAGDCHIPYHDQDAMELMFDYLVDHNAKTLLMAGDWIDFYQASRWEKDPRKRSVKEEIDIFNNVLDQIQKELPDLKLIYKFGNHEERFDNYLMNNAPALFELPEMHLESVLKLRERGITCIKNKRVLIFDKLHILHGHEYIFSLSNPVNPARGLYNRAKKSALTFHHHQTSEHTESSIDGSVVTCWSAGCLCGLKPAYMPLNKWNHGFSVLKMDNGLFNVENKRIIKNRIV